jgi:hypothetical protein
MTVLNLFLASNTFQLAESKNLSKVGFFFSSKMKNPNDLHGFFFFKMNLLTQRFVFLRLEYT